MKDEYIEKLKAQINKSGFPTELEIGKIFSEAGWNVQHNTYFVDKDENKGREIDLIGELLLQHETDTHYTEFTFRLVTEIKKENVKPWIIFSTEATDFEKAIFEIHPDRIFNNLDKRRLFESFKIHSQRLNDRLGRTFTEGFSQAKDKIYSALCNTIKAFTHSFENTNEDKSKDSVLTYVEPLVVLNGQLFEAYLGKNSNLEVKKTDFIQFRFNYISEYYKYRPNGYILNIVTKEYLPQFLKLRRQQFNKIFDENKGST